jgi:hypothetical protein
MRVLVVAVALCAVVFGASPVSARHGMAPSRQRLRVFVTVEPSKDGWTDINSDRADSAKDIAKHLGSVTRKWVLLATEEASAHIVLHVVERHMEEAGELHVVTVRLVVGDYETTVYGRAGTGWADAARNLVVQVDTWADENRDRILAKRAATTP